MKWLRSLKIKTYFRAVFSCQMNGVRTIALEENCPMDNWPPVNCPLDDCLPENYSPRKIAPKENCPLESCPHELLLPTISLKIIAPR